MESALRLLRRDRHRGLELAGGVLLAVLLFEDNDLLGQELLVLAMGKLELLGAGVLL